MFIHDLFADNGCDGAANHETHDEFLRDTLLLFLLFATEGPHASSLAQLDSGDSGKAGKFDLYSSHEISGLVCR